MGDQVVAAHKAGDPYTFQLEGASVSLAPEDVLVSTGQKEGFVAESDRDTSVVLDIRLTPALVEEGFVRELVSKIQTMRKEADFAVMHGGKNRRAIDAVSAYISALLLAEKFEREAVARQTAPEEEDE